MPIQYLGADAVPCTNPRASGHPYPRISRHACREIPMANDVPLSTNQHNYNPSPRARFRCRARALSLAPERFNSLTWQSGGNICSVPSFSTSPTGLCLTRSVSRSFRNGLCLPACLLANFWFSHQAWHSVLWHAVLQR